MTKERIVQLEGKANLITNASFGIPKLNKLQLMLIKLITKLEEYKNKYNRS
jgi:hypothetical protein